MDATVRPARVLPTSNAHGSSRAAAAASADAQRSGWWSPGTTRIRSAPLAPRPVGTGAGVTAVTDPPSTAASAAASPSSSSLARSPPGSTKHHTAGPVPPASGTTARTAVAGSSSKAPSSSRAATASAEVSTRRRWRATSSTRTGPTRVGEPASPTSSGPSPRSARPTQRIKSASTSTRSSGFALDGSHRRSAVDSTAGNGPSTSA